MAHKKYSKERLISAIGIALTTGKWFLSKHAIIRMRERNITAPELEYVLSHGFHNPKKDERSDKDWKYAIEGKTIDLKRLRIIVLFENDMLIVTVIDLDLDKGT